MAEMSTTSKSSSLSYDTVRDILLWRRKKLSVLVPLVSTATWLLLDVYQFNFITIASWTAMLLVTGMFVYGNLVRLFSKEEPDLSGLKISELAAIEAANSVRQSIEEGIRWTFHISTKGKWFVLVRVVAVLWLLSYVGSCVDFVTLLYIGVVGSMIVPVLYVKNEDKIKRCEEWMRMQAKRLHEMVDDKVFKRMKNKMAKVKEAKEKKAE